MKYITLEAIAAVSWRYEQSVPIDNLQVGLVPKYAVCRLLLTFGQLRFLLYLFLMLPRMPQFHW